MIMAGRGWRLGDLGDQTKKVGIPPTSPVDLTIDMPTLTEKISEIDVTDVNPITLNHIQTIFTKLCASKEVLKNTLSELHNKALIEAQFSEKFVIAVEQLSNVEIDGLGVRSVFLSFIQEDFKSRDTLAESNPKKFINIVILLGAAYRRIKVGGKPFTLMGDALLKCCELLLNGGEEELKTITKQVILGATILSESKELTEVYDQLKVNLRKKLISGNQSTACKCWILLTLDFISNNFRPLTGAVNEFYVNNLGDEYLKLESILEVPTTKLNNSLSSPESLKSQESQGSGKQRRFDQSHNKGEGSKKDISKKFSDLNIKTDFGGFKGKKEKVLSPPGKGGKRGDNWKFSERPSKGNPSSGHDDRFEKDENFYGVQMPRRPKPENQRKSQNENPKSPTSVDTKKEPQVESTSPTKESQD